LTQFIQPATISDIFKKIPEFKAKPYLVTDKTISYGQLYDHARKLASFFIEKGIKPGDRVVIASNDDASVILLFLSILANGITAIIVDPDTTKNRADSYYNLLEPKALFLDKKIKDSWRIEEVSQVIEIKTAGNKKSLFKKLLGRESVKKIERDVYPDLLEAFAPCDLPDSIDQELDAYIVFTSGTTSTPKGVQISHKSLFSHLFTLSRQFRYDSNSRCLNVAPLFHVSGLVDGVLGALFNSSTLYRTIEFSVQNIQSFLDSIYTHRITHVYTVPTMIGLINKFGKEYGNAFDTEDFKVVYCSGSLLDPTLWKEFQDLFNVRLTNFYGLSETITGGLFCGPDDDSFVMGTIGKPIDCDARIIDHDGREVESGKIGELLLKGDNIMKGYLNACQETDKVLKNGWFHTGDLVLKDESGHYRIKGRKKSMIISGGTNIMPEEINEILLSHKEVNDAATFGMPNEVWGEIVVCGIVIENNASLTEIDIINWCRDFIEPMKLPRKVYFLDTVPRTKSGKIDSTGIKKHVFEHYILKDQAAKADAQDRIISAAVLAFKVPAEVLDLNSNFENTTGWDSLTHLIFITELEEEFDIGLSSKEIIQIASLGDALSLIKKNHL